MLPKKLAWLILAALLAGGACAVKQQPQNFPVREEYVKAKEGLDARIKEAILKGEAIPGMTAEQVMISCGPPKQVISERNRIGGYDTVWKYQGFAVVFGDDSVAKEVR